MKKCIVNLKDKFLDLQTLISVLKYGDIIDKVCFCNEMDR